MTENVSAHLERKALFQQHTPTPLPERMKLIRILRLWFPTSAKESHLNDVRLPNCVISTPSTCLHFHATSPMPRMHGRHLSAIPKESTFRQRMMLHLAVTSEEKKTLTAAEEFTWTSFAKVQKHFGLDFN